MAYVTIPKDLTKVKSKVLFGLTRRQLICFGAAVLVGVPLFFLLRNAVASSMATLCMILIMLPFFLFAMYEKHGQPLEVILNQMIQGHLFSSLFYLLSSLRACCKRFATRPFCTIHLPQTHLT